MSAALLKALHRTLAAEKSPASAESWLRDIRMVHDDLEDETRMVPMAAVHRALVTFAELASREAIPQAWKYLIAPDSLGIWVRVLRGTTMPAEAFARLDSAESEYARTTRWETQAARRDRWEGRVSIAHDPALEEDGLLCQARLAELQAVPALFGYGGAKARAASAERFAYRRADAGVRGRMVGARHHASRALSAAPWGSGWARCRCWHRRFDVVGRARRGGGRRRGRGHRGRARARPPAPRGVARADAAGARARAEPLAARGARGRGRAASSRVRSLPGSTASFGAWGRARPASSTRRYASRTACPSPSSCCAPRPRTRPSRVIGCGARPRPLACRGTRTSSRSSTTGTWPTARRTS